MPGKVAPPLVGVITQMAGMEFSLEPAEDSAGNQPTGDQPAGAQPAAGEQPAGEQPAGGEQPAAKEEL